MRILWKKNILSPCLVYNICNDKIEPALKIKKLNMLWAPEYAAPDAHVSKFKGKFQDVGLVFWSLIVSADMWVVLRFNTSKMDAIVRCNFWIIPMEHSPAWPNALIPLHSISIWSLKKHAFILNFSRGRRNTPIYISKVFWKERIESGILSRDIFR